MINLFSQAPLISYGGQKLLTKDSIMIGFQANNRGGLIPEERYGSTNTFAGNEKTSLIDGIGIHASFNRPSKMAFDKQGNLYVTEEGNNCIRKISRDATVSLFAGNGKVGNVNNSNGKLASFHGPSGIAVDENGNVFVADVFNHQIRKITAAGAVSVFAGSGQAGFVDNNNSLLAAFSFPVDVTIDKLGNIYVVDEGNHAIRKITVTGVVSTIAGTGFAGSHDDKIGKKASFNQPNGIAIDEQGNLFIADQLNHKIRKISKEGIVSSWAGSGLAGSSDNILSSLASFNHPRGITIDYAGNIYVADVANQKIRKVSTTGAVTTISGSGAPGFQDSQTGNMAAYYFPNGMALDSTGNLYVADYLNNRIRKIETYGFSISPELLPKGVQFNHRTGIFSGTALEDIINNQYTISAYNRFGSSTTSLSLTVASEPGNALSFDGFDDRVIIPDAEEFKSQIVTAELWVNVRNLKTGFGRMLLKRNEHGQYDDSYSIGIDSLLRINAAICSGDGKKEGQKFAFQQDLLEVGRWYYVAAVFRSDSMKLYVNGHLEQAVKTGFPLKFGKNALVLGFDDQLAFSIDELRIFNTDRSEKIASDQFDVMSLDAPGLVAYYNFNSGIPGGENVNQSTLVDITGHGHNGTLVNFQPLTGKESNWIESYALMVPKAMEAKEISQHSFTATWMHPKVGEVDSYLLDVSTKPDFSSFVTGYEALPIAGNTMKITGLSSGVNYYYRVVAEKNSVGQNGCHSNAIQVATLAIQ